LFTGALEALQVTCIYPL